jgi:hypothetical protein
MMDSNILKKDHWRTGYLTFSKYHSPNCLTILEKIPCQLYGWKEWMPPSPSDSFNTETRVVDKME